METNISLFPVVRDDINFDTLNSTAQASLSASGSQSWSNLAPADPGVTLLEALTYGVSDLAYRHSLPLNDLLTTEDNTRTSLFPESFSPENALTCDPVTTDDYRRALLDLHSTDDDSGHFYFRDVQFIQEPENERYKYFYHSETREFNFKSDGALDTNGLTLRGNYWLYLALQNEGDKTTAEARVNTWLEHHRNLGESVSKIIWLSPSPVNLKTTIELEDWVDSTNDTVQVLARIYQAASQWCTPVVTRYTTQQLLDQGMTPDSIMEGPCLKHGWIPLLPDEINYSAQHAVVLNLLVNPLLKIPGVKRISTLECNEEIKEGSYACLWAENNPEQAYEQVVENITLISKGGIQKKVTAEQLSLCIQLEPLIQMTSTLLPAGRFRKPGASHPVSELLPPCYGLQSWDPVPEQKQLHQFILPFEQLLSNGCQQLAKLPQRLSFERESGSNVWGYEWPLLPSSPAQEVHQSYETSLNTFLKNSQNDVNKELGTVDYLLSYFDRTIASPGLDSLAYLSSQQYYLSHYATLAAQRSTIRTTEVSSLQKRLTARLGLHFDQLSEAESRFDDLPFYLIEHRKLLPEKPDTQFDGQQQIKLATLDSQKNPKYLKLTLSEGSAENIRVGQLVDLLLPTGAGDEQEQIRCLLVVSVDTQDNAFCLEIATSSQLNNDLTRVTDAAKAGSLFWLNSATWLQDMNYQLSPDLNQEEVPAGQKRLMISPYPIMINQGDELTAQFEITPEGAVDGETVQQPLSFTVTEVDPIHSKVVMAIQKDVAWPTDNALQSYGWFFGNNSYVVKDRFSFVVSLVFRQSLVSHSDDPYALEAWMKNIIREEVPAHISVVFHWMTDDDFNALASSYHSWQNAGTEVGIYSFGLLKKLALGHIPSSLNGIGAVFIADTTQREAAMGTEGNEWHPEVIEQDELLYVPAEIVESQ